MGTGVGEAMLIGAVTGAGTSAITGGDPLKGAMFGALGGGVTSGIGGALGGSSGAASGATAATTTPALSSAAAQIPSGAAGNVGMGMSGFGNTVGSTLAPTTAGSVGTFGNVGASGFGQAALPSATGTAGAGASAAIPSGAAATPAGFDLRNLPSTGDLLSRKDEIKTGGSALANLISKYPIGAPAAGGAFTSMIMNRPGEVMPEEYEGPLKRFRYNPATYRPAYAGGGLADGGITDIDVDMQRNMYPQSQFAQSEYAVPSQLPTSAEVVMASGGIADLGSYSDGGRLLKGPGDGMSDSIPAQIGRKQPARLADGEFVVPADVVSHLGNGSTDAGAKQLYSMMDKVRKARTGNKKQGKEISPRKFMPA